MRGGRAQQLDPKEISVLGRQECLKMSVEHSPFYKNKGDINNCNNYKGIKLLNQIIKVWERVNEMSMRRNVSISEKQFWFMPEQLKTKVINL